MLDPSSAAELDSGSIAVSIVVPTRDRPIELAACLGALARLVAADARHEVVLIDDGGRLPAEAVAAPFASRLDLRVVRQSPSGPACARNRGAVEARGALLAFTDDDCEPEPSWLCELLAGHRRWPAAVVGGRIDATRHASAFAAASQTLLDYLYARANRDPDDARFFATSNLAVPREAFLAAGGFDEAYPRAAGEDRAFCSRWSASGRRLVFAPAARVAHHHPLRARRFLDQHFRYGRGAHRLDRDGLRERAFSGLGFYVGLLRFALSARAAGDARLRVASLLLAAQAATATGYLCEATAGAAARRRSSAPQGSFGLSSASRAIRAIAARRSG